MQVVSDVWVIARRESGGGQRHIRHVTTGVADDHDRRARRLVARKSRFSCSGRRKMAGGVLDDGTTAVFAGRSLAKALFCVHSAH